MPKNQNNHTQPTKEELDDKIKEATEIPEEELTKVEDEPEPVVEEEPKELQPEEEPVEEEKEEEPLKKEIEEKDKKLSASARENQKIYAKNRVINKALIDAEEVPEPSEDELRVEYSDWDIMSDIEKTMAKETVISRRWRQTISEAKKQAEKIEKWNESVETFTTDPKTLTDNPELEGKQEEFKQYALTEENNSVPFNVLVSAFLFEQSKSKTSNKGRMFERGLGGQNEKPQPKSDKITLEEARKIRETDYNKYKELLIAGKIESDL